MSYLGASNLQSHQQIKTTVLTTAQFKYTPISFVYQHSNCAKDIMNMILKATTQGLPSLAADKVADQ